MNEIEVFRNRLERIGINVTFIGNYPWVYLDTINGKKVEGKLMSEHKFTAFFTTITHKPSFAITSISEVFKKIRETLKQE